MTLKHAVALTFGVTWFALSCTKSPSPENSSQTTNVPPPAPPARVEIPNPHTLLLPQAQFVWETGPDGKQKPTPGPAKLVMLTLVDGSWQTDTLEDEESRVFHKALCVKTESGPRLLTIGGTDALLKLWQRRGDQWTAETLWHPSFGGKWDRLRDIEIGNVDKDPAPEMVIATHDQGVIAVLDHADSQWTVNQVFRAPNTFVHEIEIGNIDGSGKPAFFATPSQPNKADVSQAGSILAFWQKPKGGYRHQEIAQFKTSHAKEILAADLNGDGRAELYTAVEASRGHGGGTGPVEIRQCVPGKAGKWTTRLLATLPGAVQSRVLLAADLTGSGKLELVTTTMKGGIWRLSPPLKPEGAWQTQQIDAGSSGFEHAAGVADLDGNGKPELYVAADDQDEVHQYVWTGSEFAKKTIYQLQKSDLTWNVAPCTPISLTP